MPRSKSVVTMEDVAKHAGVSPQTVSRTIGRPHLVKEVTRQKVHESIAELNYIPNEAARNLASQSSRIVAVIIPTLASTAYSAIVSSIMNVLSDRGMSVLLGYSDYSIKREEELVLSLMERQPKGFILTGLIHSEKVKTLLSESNAPVVETWETDTQPIDLSVGFSNFRAGNDVGKLIINRGCKSIAFVGGKADQDPRAESRYQGLLAATKSAGHKTPARIELEMPMAAKDGIAGLDQALDAMPLVDAIFFSADHLALAALLECNRRGIAVPDHLAICGFGNYDYSDLTSPTLTSVRVHPAEMGRRAAEKLVMKLDGIDQSATEVIEHQLVRRGSC